MPSAIIRFTWAVVFLLTGLPTGWAQIPGGGQPYGAFGPRPLGQTLAPRPRTFGGRLEFTPDGSFRGMSSRGSAFATPWRQPLAPPVYPHQPLIPAPFGEPTLPSGMPPMGQQVGPQLFPQIAPPAEFAPQSIAPEALGMPEPTQTGPQLPLPSQSPLPSQGTSLAPVRAREYTAYRPIGQKAPAGSPLVRSAPLSDRLTRLANGAGTRAPAGISVYLQGGTAILRGTVATAHDRELLGNVVALEPGIGQIDNRLTVGPEAGK